jgi:tetratricopeptide (TPR) repeat protein
MRDDICSYSKNNKKFVESMIFVLFLFSLVTITLCFLGCAISTADVAAAKTSTFEPEMKVKAILPQLYAGIGNFLYKLGNYTGAIMYFDYALAIDPNSVGTLSNKGIVLSLLGKYAEAITYFDKALELDPNSVSTLAGMKI